MEIMSLDPATPFFPEILLHECVFYCSRSSKVLRYQEVVKLTVIISCDPDFHAIIDYIKDKRAADTYTSVKV